MVKIGSVVFELKWGRKWKLCCNSTEIAYCNCSVTSIFCAEYHI